jgi:hypothetical protein
MENRKRKIYWREDVQSYLPRFDSLLVENFFRMEMMLYMEGIKAGKILSYEEYDKRFRYKTEPDEKGRWEYKLRPEAEGYVQDNIVLHKVDQKLWQIFGIWASYFSAYSVLHTRFKLVQNQALFINEHTLDEAVKLLHIAFKKHLDEKEEVIKKMNRETPPSGLTSSQDLILYATNKILRMEMEENKSFDEGWHGWIPYNTTLYLESLGFIIDEDVIYEIVHKYFSSYCEPTADDITKYLDEMKGIEVQKIFNEKYRE